MSDGGRISRRTVLKGIGTALALPLLDAMRPLGAFASIVANKPPVRMAFLFTPNGVNLAHWRVGEPGPLTKLPKSLSPLESVKSHVLAMTGLTQDKARPNGDGAGDHARSNATYLTGAQARKTNGADIRVGQSIDQFIADQVGSATRLPSLELGIERGNQAGNCDSGYSCAYSSNLSWRGPSTPMAKETNPRLAFERLFGDSRESAAARDRARQASYEKSILDLVREDAKALQAKLGGADQAKLDEYLESVRAIEKQLQSVEQAVEKQKPPPELQLPAGIPSDNQQHIRLMADILALAFQADITRIVSFSLANDGSNRTFPSVGVTEGHHSLSHHGRKEDKLEKIQRIDQYYVLQFAYLIDRLRGLKEADGTVLDNSMLVYGSAISDGDRHNHDDLPILFAGGGGGTITTGRHVVYPKNTPMCNLFLSMMDRVGAKAEQFADSTGRLPDLKV